MSSVPRSVRRCTLLAIVAGPHLPVLAEGPGLGNLAYAAGERFQEIARFDTSNGVPHGYGFVNMHRGWMMVIFSADGVTLTDQIDGRSVNSATLIVRTLGGDVVPGRHSNQTGILNFWPDGEYHVRIVSGDADHFNGTFSLLGEGVPILSGSPSTGSRWVEGAADIRVIDGRLTLSNGPGAANNKVYLPGYQENPDGTRTHRARDPRSPSGIHFLFFRLRATLAIP